MKKNIIKLILASAIFIFTQTSNAGPAVSGNDIPSYFIGPGDILEISVWKEEGLQKEVLVRPDGGISFPLVGEIQAGGKTTVQLQDTIVKNIKRYIPDPVVTISVLKINDNKIFVVGKVNRAGEFVATHYIDVMQALSMAGGLNPYLLNTMPLPRAISWNKTSSLRVVMWLLCPRVKRVCGLVIMY